MCNFEVSHGSTEVTENSVPFRVSLRVKRCAVANNIVQEYNTPHCLRSTPLEGRMV